MQYGDFYYPMPVNEPVLNYAPGTKEKLALKKVLKKLKLEKNTRLNVQANALMINNIYMAMFNILLNQKFAYQLLILEF